MEIPLIARVREHVLHNTLLIIRTIMALIILVQALVLRFPVSLMLSMDIAEASAWTASVNLLAGGAFCGA